MGASLGMLREFTFFFFFGVRAAFGFDACYLSSMSAGRYPIDKEHAGT